MDWKMDRCNAYELLERLALEYWHLSPLPDLQRQEGGKPWFPDLPDHHFNVSHSGELSLCALSDRPVGVDIERIRPRRDKLPAYVCSPSELAWYQERGSRWEDFFILWTMKEAKVKCTGLGLRIPAREITVPLPEGEPALDLEGFHYTLLAGEGWRGAVCERDHSNL